VVKPLGLCLDIRTAPRIIDTTPFHHPFQHLFGRTGVGQLGGQAVKQPGFSHFVCSGRCRVPLGASEEKGTPIGLTPGSDPPEQADRLERSRLDAGFLPQLSAGGLFRCFICIAVPAGQLSVRPSPLADQQPAIPAAYHYHYHRNLPVRHAGGRSPFQDAIVPFMDAAHPHPVQAGTQFFLRYVSQFHIHGCRPSDVGGRTRSAA